LDDRLVKDSFLQGKQWLFTLLLMVFYRVNNDCLQLPRISPSFLVVKEWNSRPKIKTKERFPQGDLEVSSVFPIFACKGDEELVSVAFAAL
jgi:hypothetical protein